MATEMINDNNLNLDIRIRNVYCQKNFYYTSYLINSLDSIFNYLFSIILNINNTFKAIKFLSF